MAKKKIKKKAVKKIKFHVISYRLRDDEYRDLKDISLGTGEYISSITRLAVKCFIAGHKKRAGL